MKHIQKLLFVDTNIWLDFYRAQTEAGLTLLNHLETVSDKIIVTYQLEMEFKKNRQNAILEGMQGLKPPQHITRPGLFSDAKAVKIMQKGVKADAKRIKSLKARYANVLKNPASYDPVYQICQRIFHKNDASVLKIDNKLRYTIRRKAFHRFILGCPPRKNKDTSIGDAFNWEWMIHCAVEMKAELVIVSRDSDYGVTYENNNYISDHLKQEFSERVSKKRKILLYGKLSDALKHFSVNVTSDEAQEEELIIQTKQKEPGLEAPTLAIEELEK